MVEPGQTSQIDVVLAEAASPAPSAAAPRGANHTLAYAVGGAGLLGVALGAATGLVAFRKNASSTDVCPNDGVCRDASARSDNRAAGTWATASTVSFVAGGALLGAAVVLFVTASRPKVAATLRPFVPPSVGLGPGGLVGAW